MEIALTKHPDILFKYLFLYLTKYLIDNALQYDVL